MKVLVADATGEIQLSGSRSELHELVEAFSSNRRVFQLDTTGDPAPYSRALAAIDVQRTSGMVGIFVSADGATLELRGASEALEMLGSNIEGYAADGDCCSHLHVEHLPGHEYLSQDSAPLVITLCSQK